MNEKKYVASLLVIIVIAAMWTAIPQAQTAARARLIHVASTVPVVDIYVNGELAVADLAYGESSAYFALPSGATEFRATREGTSAQLLVEWLNLESDSSSILISAKESAQLAVIPDDMTPLDLANSRLLIVNALDFAYSVAIESSDVDRQTSDEVAPGDSLGPIELAAARIELDLHPANGVGKAAPASFGANLAAGSNNTLVIHGSSDDPQLLHAMAAVDADAMSGRVRFVHAVPGAAPVDLKINDRMIVPNLAFAAPTEHIPLPGGSQELTVSLGGAVLSSMSLDVSAGQLHTVVVMGTPAALTIQQYQDSPRDLSASAAVVSLLNAAPNSSVNQLRLDSGAIVAADVGFGEAGGAAQIVPGVHSMSLILDIGDERGTIDVPPFYYYAGSYFNLIALSGSAFTAPRLLIAETSLARRVAAAAPSMPASEDVKPDMSADEPAADADSRPATAQTEVEPETEADLETELQPEADPVSQADETGASKAQDEPEADAELDPTNDSQPATESDAPGQAELSMEPGPSLVLGPYAIVDLDPSARLQLRQYPSRDALSLGLLPGETNLVVLGRRGLTLFYSDEVPDLPIDLSDYDTDPAAALYPVQDLQPAETWLFVMYQTVDGGALLGWVNALYLRVYDEAGEDQRLASLPTVRQNRAGGAFNTEAQSPDLADHVTARVYRLNPDGRLNMRAANDPESEVMMQLAPNAELNLIGMDATDEWAFVDYAANSGEIISGWVSAAYVQLLLNGEPVRPSTLRALDETVAPRIGDDIRGSIRRPEDTGPTPIPPSDDMMRGIVGEVALDPGAMLHLRRSPDANSESLALIPAESRVAISGITENREWLKARYEEQDGWVSSRYVALLLRGRLYHRTYVESLLPAHNNAGIRAG